MTTQNVPEKLLKREISVNYGDSDIRLLAWYLDKYVTLDLNIDGYDFALRYERGSGKVYLKRTESGAQWDNLMARDLSSTQEGTVSRWCIDLCRNVAWEMSLIILPRSVKTKTNAPSIFETAHSAN